MEKIESYHVGDTVRIRTIAEMQKDLSIPVTKFYAGIYALNALMRPYLDTVTTVTGINESFGTLKLECDKGGWNWHMHMVEHYDDASTKEDWLNVFSQEQQST